MGMMTPGDHSILTSAFSTADALASDIGQRVTLELDQLMKKALADKRIVITHTVTLFEKLETVVLTLHTSKPN